MQNIVQNLAVANDVTVTKFLNDQVGAYLEQLADDISVTKFLAENDVSVTKFLQQAEDDIAVTKYLASNDITVTKFLEEIQGDLGSAKFLAQSNGDEAVTKYLQQAMDDIAVTKYLETVLSKFLEEDNGDISVTKFLNNANSAGYCSTSKGSKDPCCRNTQYTDICGPVANASKVLSQSNDVTVTKFLDNDNGDISVTKFLNNANSAGYCGTSAGSRDPCCRNTQYTDICGPVQNSAKNLATSNDVTVTKFLEQRSNDTTVTKFMDSSSSSNNSLTSFLEENDISVTKFLDDVVGKFLASNDITVTKFLNEEDGIAVTKYLSSNDITVTKFLDDVMPAYHREHGLDLAHYLDTTVTKFLADNDISVTKFLSNANSAGYCGTSAGRSDPCCSNTQYKDICGPVQNSAKNLATSNDVTVTKFLHGSGGSNDITVTKFLERALNQYLDTTVTKFLQNDISVTKFLAQAQDYSTTYCSTSQGHSDPCCRNTQYQGICGPVSNSAKNLATSNDVTVTKFLDAAASHFLESNDITVTKFLADNDISVTKFLQNDISVTKFLGTASTRFLETNDITVTKFLDVTVTKFLASNETAVTKFLDSNDITVTKFMENAITNFLLDDQAVSNFLDTTISRFSQFNLESSEDGIAVTKYLDNGRTPSYNTYPGSGEDNKRNVNMTIIQFLEDYIHEHPDHMLHDVPANGDISVTKFLQQNANVTQKETSNGQKMNIIQFLQDNDISVTKFMNYMEDNLNESEQNMLVIEFLDSSSARYLQ